MSDSEFHIKTIYNKDHLYSDPYEVYCEYNLLTKIYAWMHNGRWIKQDCEPNEPNCLCRFDRFIDLFGFDEMMTRARLNHAIIPF